MSSLVRGIASQRDLTDGLGLSPHETLKVHQPEIEKLFEQALAGRLPRSRELKYYEVDRLNERHLTMVMMRAGGMRQKEIGEIFNITPSNCSNILNHPDAEYLLSRLLSMRATAPTGVEERLRALSVRAVDTLEELFDPTVGVPVEKRAPSAFRILEQNGYGKPKQVEVKHQFSIDPAQSAQLSKALQEARQIVAPKTHVVQDANDISGLLEGPGGASGDSPSSACPSGAAAPSSGGPQDSEGAF